MERSQFLQFMRFLAAALVLCTHCTFYYHERISADVGVWHFGEIGVPIFFVISGIVMVLSTHGLPADASGARLFLTRRIIRIVPLYWVATAAKVTVALLVPDVVNHQHFRLDYAVKSFLFIPYFNELGAVVPMHGVGWTLLHEMFFYLVFTAVLLCRQTPATIASAVIIGLWLLGLAVEVDSPFWSVATSGANLNFITGMLAGTALVRSNQRRSLRPLVGTLLAMGSALMFMLTDRSSRYQSLPLVLAFGTAAVGLADAHLPRWTTGFCRLGDSSYSLYLFHPFVAPATLLLLHRAMPSLHAQLVITLAVLITVAAAHLIHLGVEVPVVSVARRILLGHSSGRKRVSKAS